MKRRRDTSAELKTLIADGEIVPVYCHLFDVTHGYALSIPRVLQNDHVFSSLLPYAEGGVLLSSFSAGILPNFCRTMLEMMDARLFHNGQCALRLMDHRRVADIPAPQSSGDTVSMDTVRETPDKVNLEELIVLRSDERQLVDDLQLLTHKLLSVLEMKGVRSDEKTAGQVRKLHRKFWRLHAHVSKQDHHDETDTKPSLAECHLPSTSTAVHATRTHSELSDALRKSCPLSFIHEIIAKKRVMKMQRTRQLTKQYAEIDAEHDGVSFEGFFRSICPVGEDMMDPIKIASLRNSPEQRTSQPYKQKLTANLYLSYDTRLLSELFEIEQLTIVMQGGDGEPQTTSITIYAQPCTRAHYGRILLQSSTARVTNGPFILGVESDSRAYMTQYLEMITEGGRKQPISVQRKQAAHRN